MELAVSGPMPNGEEGLRGPPCARQLRTEAVGLSPAFSAAEALTPGDPRRFRVGGLSLGAVAVETGFAPIPLEAFDRVAPRLQPCAQAAWFHFLRLSYGVGRDFCRVSKREMLDRLQLSERRLNETLDALVGAGCLQPLHRDNRGTLYRVFSPGEVLGEPDSGLRRGELTDSPACARPAQTDLGDGARSTAAGARERQA